MGTYYNSSSSSHDLIIVFSQVVAASFYSMQNLAGDMNSDSDLLDIITSGLSFVKDGSTTSLQHHEINLFLLFLLYFCFNSILILGRLSVHKKYFVLDMHLDAGYSRWSERFPHIKEAVGQLGVELIISLKTTFTDEKVN